MTSPTPADVREAVVVDLRSDTLTQPSEAMRSAMATAEVGDDVYGEDPTVGALEAHVAGLFGHEAALFVPSGTMGNQICLALLVPPGQEVLCDGEAHILTNENGAAAALFGITTRTFTSADAHLDVDAVGSALRPAGFGTLSTAAIAVEQTHNRSGGSVHPLEALRGVRDIAAAAGVAMHCDGARIWNAHIASGTSLAEYGALFDTLSVCLSKGLGAPVGSLVVSSAERVARARVIRKRLGGGMRQAGVLAAAGLYALGHHLERLAEDHRRARQLGAQLGHHSPVESNILRLNISDYGWTGPDLAAAARARGVRIGVAGPAQVRLVTHLDVDDDGVALAAEVLADLLQR